MRISYSFYLSMLVLGLLFLQSCQKDLFVPPGSQQNADILARAQAWVESNAPREGSRRSGVSSLDYQWDRYAVSKNSKGEDVLTVPITSKPGKKEYLELAFVLAQSGEVGVIKQYEGDLDKWEHVILNMYHADGRKFISGVYNTKTKLLTVKPLLSDKFSKLEKIASTSSSGNGSSEDDWGWGHDPSNPIEIPEVPIPPPGGGGTTPPGGGTTIPINPGGGSGSTSPTKPTLTQFKNQIKDKPFALFGDLDCSIVLKWLATAKHQVQQAQIDKLNSIRMSTTQVPWAKSEVIAKVQDINNAYSTVVNMDYFPITVNQLPVVNGVRLTPTEFKEYLRKNINSFVDSDKSNFTPYNYFGINDTPLWNSSSPNSAVIGIDIPGLLGINDEITDDDGAVIVSKFSDTGWTFTTIYDPKYGQHPVSGNRDFGYTENANGSYTFFTRGVDRLTYPAVTAMQYLSGIPFDEADALWASFQNKIANFVNGHQGQATVSAPTIERPKWQLVKDVIDGKKPLSSLSTDCKD